MKTSPTDVILEILQDGQWHSLQEIEDGISKVARPEHVMRLATRMEKYFNMDMPLQERMRKARRRYSRIAIYRCIDRGKIEARYKGKYITAVRSPF